MNVQKAKSKCRQPSKTLAKKRNSSAHDFRKPFFLYVWNVHMNYLLMNKKMLIEFAPPFSFIPQYAGIKTTSTANAVHEEGGENELSPLWYSILIQVRSFFMNGTKV